jgi:hypothetical protein
MGGALMPRDFMLHIKQPLGPEDRLALLAHLEERLQAGGEVHDSGKPHLLFVPADPWKASPRAVLGAVRERGYDARWVDL